ncbi:hypothetical protein GGS20DRAFT_587607 [Poronia punctata]|nr:hypothetical protein GGS20DRAFT_587607 [Poronia punctata]
MLSIISLLVLSFGALQALALNRITFISQDHLGRYMIATPNRHDPEWPDISVPGFATVDVDFPEAWSGNIRVLFDGAPRTQDSMLAEFTFQGGYGHTYFDVSAIANNSDTNTIKEFFPAESKSPVSGCKVYPCDRAYYGPDDKQTLSTPETHMICHLGTPNLGSLGDRSGPPPFRAAAAARATTRRLARKNRMSQSRTTKPPALAELEFVPFRGMGERVA